MFWRRRKLPEDDPLVPQGLISQAMEDRRSRELPPGMRDNSPRDVKQTPAEPVEMRLRVSAPAMSRSQETQPLPEQGKISPPIKWPRVDEAEIARRAQLIDTAVSFPYRKPVMGAAVPQAADPEPEPEIAEPAKLELVVTPPSTRINTAPMGRVNTGRGRTEKFRNLISKFRDLRLPSVAPLRHRVHGSLTQVKTTASDNLQAATNQLRELQHKSGAAVDAAKLRLANKSHAILSGCHSGLQHLREDLRGADFSGAGRAWDRVRSWKVTVRFPSLNQRVMAILVESAKASRQRAQGVLQRDSRVWASMGMAALSALLALGLISAVRHYGPDRVEAQPKSASALPVAAQAKTAPSNSLALSKTGIAAKAADRKPSPIEHPLPSKQVAVSNPPAVVPQKKEASSVKKPRVRRNRDGDDYVAKDTYVYYGSSGKPSR